MEIYLVGGAVRDKLLGLAVKDKDFVVVGATPDAMQALGYQQVGKDFPVFLHPHNKQEYALARTERKNGRGYTGFSCYAAADVTLEQDLQRRDLTINAMVEDSEGNLIDPLNARADLDNRVLRHISASFSEDPLRVLRVARFAARFHPQGFTIAAETRALMQAMTAAGDLAELTPERVWMEVEKSLTAINPAVFFQVLHDIGALAVIYPELEWLFHHCTADNPLNLGPQALQRLAHTASLSTDLSVRFAALCQDLAYADSQQGITESSIKQLAKRAKIPNEYRDLALLVSAQHDTIANALLSPAEAVLQLFDATDAWRKPARFEQVLLACSARCRSATTTANHLADYPQAQFLRAMLKAATAIAIQPIIAMGLRGPAIKQELTQQRLTTLSELQAQWPAASDK